MRFKIITLSMLTATALLMSACAPINSDFSCNATAGDSCMTIEQVDAMTRFADNARTTAHAPKNKNHHMWVHTSAGPKKYQYKQYPKLDMSSDTYTKQKRVD